MIENQSGTPAEGRIGEVLEIVGNNLSEFKKFDPEDLIEEDVVMWNGIIRGTVNETEFDLYRKAVQDAAFSSESGKKRPNDPKENFYNMPSRLVFCGLLAGVLSHDMLKSRVRLFVVSQPRRNDRKRK